MPNVRNVYWTNITLGRTREFTNSWIGVDSSIRDELDAVDEEIRRRPRISLTGLSEEVYQTIRAAVGACPKCCCTDYWVFKHNLGTLRGYCNGDPGNDHDTVKITVPDDLNPLDAKV